MPYITVKQTPRHHQYSLDELMFGDVGSQEIKKITNWKKIDACTRTYFVDRPSVQLIDRAEIPRLIRKLEWFNNQFDFLFNEKREKLYHHFEIPKKTGDKTRPIDAPCESLSNALRVLKGIFEDDFNALYHTSAFAYIKGRCTIDAIKDHQQNESRWFLHTDFSGFFPATTLDFVMSQFAMIFPFSEVVRHPRGETALRKALSLCFLNGGLPQGTPISPTITNIMMIPIDYVLANSLRDFDKHKFVYTRYADDIYISCRFDFSYRKVVGHIINTLKEFNAPYTIKEEKLHYGSNAGRNFMLGLLLTKENKISLGYERKKEIRKRIANYLKDRANNIPTPTEELQNLMGNLSYCRMVEPEWYRNIMILTNEKFGVDTEACISADIAG